MKKILLILCLYISFSLGSSAYAITVGVGNPGQANNLNIGGGGGGSAESENVKKNTKLQEFDSSNFIGVGTGGEVGLYNTLLRVARDLKNFFYIVATIFFLIICLRLIFAGNTEEELGKFKKGILWITIGLIVMQIAYAFTLTVFDQRISGGLGVRIIENLVYPLIALLQTLASIFFIAMAIFAFYRLVTANGNDEAVKSGKMTILYALIGFLIIRFARAIVEAFYGKINCENISSWPISASGENCLNTVDISEGTGIIINVINWLNGFVAIAVMLMILYAGAQIMLSGGDEEKMKKMKSSLVYIAIGLFVLAVNYLLLTFFLRPEGII